MKKTNKSSEISIKIEEINKKLRRGDKKIIAELCNLSYPHVVNVLVGKRNGGRSADIILKVAFMLIENRIQLEKQINVKSKK